MLTEIQSKTGLKTLNLNRRRAIREKCLNCCCWSHAEVKKCKFTDCSLHPYRGGTDKQNPKDRDRAIKGYCFWCMAGERAEVKKCVSVHCPLFGFRKDRVEKSNPLPKKAHGEMRIEANSPL